MNRHAQRSGSRAWWLPIPTTTIVRRMTIPTNCRSAFGALLLATLLAGPAVAQERPIVWSVASSPARVEQGATFTVRLNAEIPAGWHLYSTTQGPGGPVPTRIVPVAGGGFLSAGRVTAPDPEIAHDANFDILTETYLDAVSFTVPLRARMPGAQSLTLSVTYQTCTDRYCLPPTEVLVTTPISATAVAGAVVEAPAVPPPAPATAPEAEPPPTIAPVAAAPVEPPTTVAPLQSGGTEQSLPLFLWLAAVMGAISLLTPCVFPMIPITVSYFTRTHETTRRAPAHNALIYAGGIMATFTVLGMAIAILVGAGGINRFAANPWINLLVTGIFIAFALNLFGVWQVTLPSGLLTRLHSASEGSRGGETIGILAMGLTFTLTSFTCTAPFVGTLLVMAAGGSWQWPLLGLLVFSAVFALPFFLLALMPSAVARLPRSGAWMQRVKVMMGFLEIAMAMKFLANADMVWQWGVVTRDVVLVVWIVVAIAATLYLFGVFQRSTPRPRLPAFQLAVAGGCLVIAVFLGRGLLGARLGEFESFLPPPEGAITEGTTSVDGELDWMVNDYPGALARAGAEGKSVLVDFTGYTCTNCRWMEANMFPRPDVSRELEGFVRVRLYTDGQGPLYREQQELELRLFGTVALPYYAIMDASGTPIGQFLGMTRKPEEFVAFLKGELSIVATATPIAPTLIGALP